MHLKIEGAACWVVAFSVVSHLVSDYVSDLYLARHLWFSGEPHLDGISFPSIRTTINGFFSALHADLAMTGTCMLAHLQEI